MRSLGRCICALAFTLAGCFYDWTVQPKEGCGSTNECSKGEYCVFVDLQCGRGSRGICKSRPFTCRDSDAKVCGCGQSANDLRSQCTWAQEQGVDISGSCP